MIRVPTLVISGEEDRVDPPAVLRQELMSRIPQATLHLLPGIGHLSPLEAPGDLAALIRGFATPLIAPKIDRATIVGGDVIGPCSAVLVHADGMCVTTSDPDPAIATKVTAVIDDASPALSGPGHTIEGLLGPKEVAIPSAFERLTQKA